MRRKKRETLREAVDGVEGRLGRLERVEGLELHDLPKASKVLRSFLHGCGGGRGVRVGAFLEE